MKFSKWIKNLEKRKIVSRSPHPAIPFILAIVLLAEGFFFPFERLKYVLYYLAGFTILFAFAHWFVVRILRGKS